MSRRVLQKAPGGASGSSATGTDFRGSALTYALFAAAIAVGSTIIGLFTPANINTPIISCISLVVAAGTRSRAFVWALAVAVVVAVFAGAAVGPPPIEVRAWTWTIVWTNRTIVALTSLVIAWFVDSWIRSEQARAAGEAEVAARNQALEAVNAELVAREEEIARQNEELQSQSEELERQSEELRITNDELANREAMLAQLLNLSRTLASELTSDEVMATICQSLTALLGGGAEASSMMLRHGNELRAHCFAGFGDEGPRDTSLAFPTSFASLIVARGQAGFLEDMALRPDVQILEPRDGTEFRSVLGAPLWSRAQAIGTLEVYSRRPAAWSEEHLTLISSMAAQASTSLETAHLFEQLGGEKQRFETVFRSLPICVFVAQDTQLGRVTGNPAAAALFTVPLDANFSPFAPAPARVKMAVVRDGHVLTPEDTPLARAVRGGLEIQPEELEIVIPSGRRVAVLASAAPFFDAEGRVSGGVAVLADITPQKRLERELEARRRESEEASVRKSRFLAAVSHDIRTPANAIRLQAELIKRSASNPAIAGKVPELAHQLQANAVSLVELVGEVLDLTHFDTGKVEVQEAEFSLGEVVAEECRQLGPLAETRSLALHCERVDPPVWVRSDRIKLGRVLGNLIENAIKFTDRGEVRVAVRSTDAGVAVTVQDTGAGIGADHLPHIFDEFFQLRNPERDRAKGRGLGLAICKRLVDALGGTIDVESVVGEGSVFTVTLAASVRIAAPLGAAAPAPAAELPSANDGTTARAVERDEVLTDLRVLLVEDHDDTRTATAEILRQEGAAVVEAANGRAALEAVRSVDPAVVLLDLMLPDVDGIEVLRAIHASPPAALRAVVVLTGDSAGRHVDEMRRLGATAVIAKPCDPDRLVNELRTLLAARA